MKTLSIVTPCYNEEANVVELYTRVRAAITKIGRYKYEHIFIDNASTDATVARLKLLAAVDPNVKIIVNARNFGAIRSPMHGLLQAQGDAVILIVADLQDPPEMIPDLVQGWEEGNAMVITTKRSSGENPLMFWMRKRYYGLVNRLSSIETFQNFTGFGLYDRRVIDIVRSFNDPYPYFRGIIAEIGLPHKKLYYDQPARRRGITSNNFYSLYDYAMLGIINHSKVPLRFIVFSGFVGALLSFGVGMVYLFYKLLFWRSFSVGVAPLVIGMFFVSSMLLVFLGVIGEYVGAIHTQIQHRPFAIELERVNFEHPPQAPPAP